EAARLADALRRALVVPRDSFVFETVFSDPVGDGEAAIRAPLSSASPSSSSSPAWRPRERVADNWSAAIRPELAAGREIADTRVLEECARTRGAVEERDPGSGALGRSSPPLSAPPPRPSGRM